MRTVTIDFSADETRRIVSFGGYDGEHNETNLCAILPPRLLSEEVTQYRFVFTNSNGEEITKEPLKAIDGAVSYLLPQQVMAYPELKFYVAALTYDGMENLIVLGKTATASLTIECPSDGVETEENPYPDNIPIGYTVRNSADGIRSAEDASDNELATEKAISEALEEERVETEKAITEALEEERTETEKAITEALEEERNGRYSKEESDNRFANALKGKASGNPITIADASPLSHEMAVTVSVAGETVTKRGKNLFDPAVLEAAGMVLAEDGYYSGKSNLLSAAYHWSSGNLGSMYNGFLPNTQYAFRMKGRNLNFGSDTNGSVGFYFQYSDGTRSKAIYLYGNTDNPDADMTISFVSDAQKSVTGLHCSNSYTFDILIKEFQLEYGSANTDFEEYKAPETYTDDDEDGVIRGIIADGGTVVLAGENDFTITAEYNRDINKVIESIANAIISLGGKV